VNAAQDEAAVGSPALTPTEQSRRAELEGRIRAGLETFYQVGEALTEIRDSLLYRSTHATWKAYLRDVWDMSDRYGRYLAAAVEVQQTLAPVVGQIVEGVSITAPAAEAQVRPLAALPDADARQQAWADAHIASGGSAPTAVQVRDAATRQQVYASTYSIVKQWMDTGRLKPAAALSLVNALDQCQPRVRGDVLRLEITDRAMVLEMNRIARSETYAEIVATRHLNLAERTVPASQARAMDLRDLLDERMREHRAAAADARSGAALSLVIFPDDPARTLKLLRDALGETRYNRLANALAAQMADEYRKAKS
jgi:hypothetical protein